MDVKQARLCIVQALFNAGYGPNEGYPQDADIIELAETALYYMEREYPAPGLHFFHIWAALEWRERIEERQG